MTNANISSALAAPGSGSEARADAGGPWLYAIGTELFDVIAGGFPRAVLFLPDRHRLHRRLFVLKACLKLQDNIGPVRCTWECGRVLYTSESARHHGPQGAADAIQGLSPCLLGHGALEISRSCSPTGCVRA